MSSRSGSPGKSATSGQRFFTVYFSYFCKVNHRRGDSSHHELDLCCCEFPFSEAQGGSLGWFWVTPIAALLLSS